MKPLALIVVSIYFLGCFYPAQASDFSFVSKAEQAHIGDLIFRNECARDERCLVSWNDGEKFASLGIGHFIWFPADVALPFQESFPDLLRWMAAHHIDMPASLAWLTPQTPCPWPDKTTFLSDEQQPKVQALRDWLAQNKSIQVSFILKRLQGSLEKMLAVSTTEEGKLIDRQFARITQAKDGAYILADYVNFKGEGVKESEQYQGQGWGLRQVLLSMSAHESPALAFVNAAKIVLQQRVDLSPPTRGEARWLKGWFKRLDTYLQ